MNNFSRGGPGSLRGIFPVPPALPWQTCGGSLTEEVQNFILELCVENSVHSDILFNSTYVKNILKKVIVTAESTCEVVVEGLYERLRLFSVPVPQPWVSCLVAPPTILRGKGHLRGKGPLYLKLHWELCFIHGEYVMRGEENKIFKKISYLFPFGTSDQSCLTNLVVSLHCSLNLLEGDTGCALWPSSLFLSEFILSYPKLFSEKVCFEVGSGVGLVGVALAHVGASKQADCCIQPVVCGKLPIGAFFPICVGFNETWNNSRSDASKHWKVVKVSDRAMSRLLAVGGWE
ncbi:hypothetical protein MA16_Dca016801 [Dendrobium catenatum]|uniref:Uncharacterized protein n=1 Tax=Dendrobium catenatum TaxID=906689 RepID=A0A2I0VYG8_9ASPA|nr:hypothetical protein MA16_Dca016801 [Dendrobium catenatum]